MHTSDAIARLETHQQHLLDHMAAALALLAGKPDGFQAELGKHRWHMVRLMREYQVFKHSEIFDPMMRAGSPIQAALARDLKTACIAASESFRAYTLQWSSTDVAQRWAEYRPAMLDMVRAIQEHIAVERDGVRALLAGALRTRYPHGGACGQHRGPAQRT